MQITVIPVILIILTILIIGIYFYKKISEKKNKKEKKIISMNDQFFQELKKILINNDLGLSVTNLVINNLKKYHTSSSLNLKLLQENVSSDFINTLIKHKDNLNKIGVKTPQVFVLLGNNGIGKTSLAVKLANYLNKNNSSKILITSLDFFRAGAWEQLEILVKKNNNANIEYLAPTVKNVKGHVYASYEYAEKNYYDILILDTSGRIHTNDNLMEELKHLDDILKSLKANKKNILVLDNNFGTTAINSYESFKETLQIDGIIITKLDSKCGGGWLMKLVDEEKNLKIFGQVAGESFNDFQEFNPENFANKIINWSEVNVG